MNSSLAILSQTIQGDLIGISCIQSHAISLCDGQSTSCRVEADNQITICCSVGRISISLHCHSNNIGQSAVVVNGNSLRSEASAISLEVEVSAGDGCGGLQSSDFQSHSLHSAFLDHDVLISAGDLVTCGSSQTSGLCADGCISLTSIATFTFLLMFLMVY